MYRLKIIIMMLLFCNSISSIKAQPIALSPARRAVRISGDATIGALAIAGLTAVLAQKDWQGLKQGAFSAITTVGATTALKYIVREERPDHSNFRSFPSLHTSAAFCAAAFVQRRYGWKWGAPAYVLSSYVAFTRVFARKHHWWDVLAGAAIGAGSSYIFTRPFARKHQLTIAPIAGDGCCGLYASLVF